MKNYCRIPDDKEKPWCFTNETEWGFCDVCPCDQCKLQRSDCSRPFTFLHTGFFDSDKFQQKVKPWHSSWWDWLSCYQKFHAWILSGSNNIKSPPSGHPFIPPNYMELFCFDLFTLICISKGCLVSTQGSFPQLHQQLNKLIWPLVQKLSCRQRLHKRSLLTCWNIGLQRKLL